MSLAELKKLKSQLEKKHGSKTVKWADEIDPPIPVPSGSLAIDFITGIGGIPHNRVVDLYGAPGSGKSTLAMHIMDSFLKKFPDKGAVYIDIEATVTYEWLSNFVDDIDRVLIVQPDTIEEAANIAHAVTQTGEVSIIVLDSIGGALSMAEMDKPTEDVVYAGSAKGVTRFAKRAQTAAGKYGVCFVIVNQLRVDMSGYNQDNKPGGTALQHALSLSIKLRKGRGRISDKIDGEDVVVGHSVVATVTKNKVGPPNKSATFWFYSQPSSKGDLGIDAVEEMTSLSVAMEVVERRGAWIYHSAIKPDGKVQGREALRDYAKNNPDFLELISDEVRSTLRETNGRGLVTSVDENGIGEYDMSEDRQLS